MASFSSSSSSYQASSSAWSSSGVSGVNQLTTGLPQITGGGIRQISGGGIRQISGGGIRHISSGIHSSPLGSPLISPGGSVMPRSPQMIAALDALSIPGGVTHASSGSRQIITKSEGPGMVTTVTETRTVQNPYSSGPVTTVTTQKYEGAMPSTSTTTRSVQGFAPEILMGPLGQFSISQGMQPLIDQTSQGEAVLSPRNSGAGLPTLLGPNVMGGENATSGSQFYESSAGQTYSSCTKSSQTRYVGYPALYTNYTTSAIGGAMPMAGLPMAQPGQWTVMQTPDINTMIAEAAGAAQPPAEQETDDTKESGTKVYE